MWIYFISLSVLYLQLQIWWSCSSCLQDQQSTNWNHMMTKRYVGTDCLKAIKFQILTFLLLILSAMYLKLRYHTSLLLYPAFRITRFPLYKRNEDHSPILASALPLKCKTLQEAKPVKCSFNQSITIRICSLPSYINIYILLREGICGPMLVYYKFRYIVEWSSSESVFT